MEDQSPWKNIAEIVKEQFAAPVSVKISAGEKGKFFVFEGIDGCGKATQTRLLTEYYKSKGFEVEKIDFPQHGERSSAMVDDYLTGKYGESKTVKPEVASIFYATDRYDASFKIKKWLAEGKIVIADRYLVSNIGHQGGKILGQGKGVSEWKKYVDWLYNLEYNIFGIPKPDYTFILKTSAEFSLKLANKITDEQKKETRAKYLGDDKKQDIHEKDGKHLENALNSYLMVAREFPNDFAVVECLENNEMIPAVEINKKIVNIINNPASAKATAGEEKPMAKVVQNAGSFKILSIMTGLNGESPLQLIETAGRTAYQSRDKITDQSALKFAEVLRKRGHESVFEHSCMTVEFNNVSRGLTHELVRHRIAAFTQESTRYVDEKDFMVVAPPNKNIEEKLVEIQIPQPENSALKASLKVSFKDWVEMNEQMYKGLRAAGWVPQDARQILPTGIDAQIVMTANLREWRHVLKLRCSIDSHWEIREVMVKLLKEVKQRIPVLFDDFEISADGLSATIKKPE